MPSHIVVIGGSSGAIDALKTIVSELPADFPAPILAVVHTAADSPGVLGTILERAGPLRAITVQHRQRLEPGRIYVPLPDHHLLVEPGSVLVTRGPKENRFRPAVDPLFRSAAQIYGPRTIGVILSGGLDDGTAGLWAIKQLGGVTIVQDPKDAVAESMPLSALKHVRVDHRVALQDIAALLVRVTAADVPPEQPLAEVPKSFNIEVDVAKAHNGIEAGVLTLGSPSNYGCPECHGVLLELKEGDRARFRCHTGHAYSVASLVAEIDEAVEEALWNAVRSLEEKMLLLKQIGSHSTQPDNLSSAEILNAQAQEAQRRAELVRKALGLDE